MPRALLEGAKVIECMIGRFSREKYDGLASRRIYVFINLPDS
jgi:hypothetical protein